jgi:hypothetical protein
MVSTENETSADSDLFHEIGNHGGGGKKTKRPACTFHRGTMDNRKEHENDSESHIP